MRLPDDSCPETLSVAREHQTLVSFAVALEEKPVWAGLYENLHDLLFPSRLPPLELTSTPIPVVDRMAVRTSRWAVGTSTLVNGGAIAVMLLLGMRVIHPIARPDPGRHVDIDSLTIFAPAAQLAGGGGGGGSNDLIDPIAGRTPRQDMHPITPPQVPVLLNPKLAIEPAIAVPLDIKLPDNPSLPNIGVHTSTNVLLASNGTGTEAGIGVGAHGGDGPGEGIGYGPGRDRGAGNGIYRPGVGGVTNPVAIVSPEAEFSDEARRAKYQGICMISIIVDAHGYPQNPRVVRSLGMGLDEKALDAVRRYRFKPAMKDGRPVAAMITVEVDFRLY
jgi:protein TonB